MKFIKKILVLIFVLQQTYSYAQLPFNLIDARMENTCQSCKDLIDQKPQEVLFGVQINANGDVYFSMNNNEWFNKIIKDDNYGSY
jgi:hypothetical protein